MDGLLERHGFMQDSSHCVLVQYIFVWANVTSEKRPGEFHLNIFCISMSSARSGLMSDRWLLLHSMWMSSPHTNCMYIYITLYPWSMYDPFKSSLLPHIFVQLKLLERPEPTTFATLIECPFQIHQVLSLACQIYVNQPLILTMTNLPWENLSLHGTC